MSVLKADMLVFKAQREVGGLAELARKTGYAHQTISNWRSGRVSPPFRGVLDCLNAAGLDIVVVKK